MKKIDRILYHRRLFFLAGLWNIAIAIGITIFSIFWKQALSVFVNPAYIPESMIWLQLFISLVFCFGLGYFWVSQDTLKNHAVISMAIIGKIFVFLIISYYMVIRHTTFLIFPMALIDLIFAGLFIEDLIKIKAR